MIKQVLHPKVSEIFPVNDNIVYQIPKYQREYTWKKNDWDALFRDVNENDLGYFLGSYICVNRGSLGGTILEVIDGQQRFTTILLLFTALYEKLNALKEQMDDEEKNDLANLRNMLANKKQTYTHNGIKNTEYSQRLILQKQNMNDEDFAHILSSKGIITANKEASDYFSNRRIAKAYKRFGELIDEELAVIKNENTNISEVGALFSIVHKFENAIMVGIEVDTNKDAYMLFESLNHRGVPLSAIDLIKNTLIALADSLSDADNSYEIWKRIISNVSNDDYSVQERFFRQYYNAFREELNAPYKSSDKKYYLGYLATRTTLLDIYEKMMKNDYKTLLDDLLIKSRIYSLITNNSDEDHIYSAALDDLEKISGAPSYILLLYVMSNQNKLGLNDENLEEIIRVLITFFVRRNVTDVPNTRKLTQLFIDTISEIKIKKGTAIVKAIKEKLISVSAPDDIFESKLRGPIYDENPEATRFLLCSIEAKYQTKEIYSNLWSRDKKNNKYIWTIEHIFPEGENIPDAWVDMIANGDKALSKKYRSDYVHTLGNLTITGYNQNLSNMSFEQKRDRKSKDNKNIGYRNGLYLNQTVVSENSWTIDSIKKRTESIVNLLKGMYKW